MIGMFIFAGYSGRIQRVGEKYGVESIPELFGMRFGKTAKCVLAVMVVFAMVGTVACLLYTSHSWWGPGAEAASTSGRRHGGNRQRRRPPCPECRCHRGREGRK